MFPMVTARLIVRAQVEMTCILQDKEGLPYSRPPAMEYVSFFLREVEGSHKQTDGLTYIHGNTIVPSWFDVSHSVSFLFEEPHFYQYRFGLL